MGGATRGKGTGRSAAPLIVAAYAVGGVIGFADAFTGGTASLAALTFGHTTNQRTRSAC